MNESDAEKILRIVSKYAERTVSMDDLITEDLGLSSLKVMYILSEIEGSLGYSLYLNGTAAIRTVGDLIRCLRKMND